VLNFDKKGASPGNDIKEIENEDQDQDLDDIKLAMNTLINEEPSVDSIKKALN
jgi:hypothetical protein